MENLENTNNNILNFGIVTYNKSFNESETCKTLSDLKIKNVYIADNSTKKNNIKRKCLGNNWKYIPMNGNKGISIAYNAIINEVKKNKIDSHMYIMWLDDDTKITEGYLKKVYNNINDLNEKNDIFIPIIKDSNNNIISPSIYTKLKFFRIKKEEQAYKIKYKNIIAINTCMVVNFDIYKNYKYDENLFLDNVDHQFILDMEKKKRKIKIINYVIYQNFFTTDNKNYSKEITRKKIEIHDYKYFIKNKGIIVNIVYYFRILYWKIKGCIKYHTLKYFFDLGW